MKRAVGILVQHAQRIKWPLVRGGGGAPPAGQEIQGALFSNAATFFAATIAPGAVDIAGALFTNTPTFYSANVAVEGGQQNITGVLFTNSNTFYEATIAPGPVDIAGALFTNSSTFYTTTVAAGAVDIAGALLTNSTTFYGATVAQVWTPNVLIASADLKAWWSADQHGTADMTDDGGGLISAWTDNTGDTAMAAASAERPTWAATSFNTSYPGVTFDGSATVMTATTLTAIPTGPTAGMLWLVLDQARPSTTTGAETEFGYGANVADAARIIRRPVVSSTNRFRTTPTPTGTELTDTSVDYSNEHIVCASFNGTTLSGWIDGNATSPASATITSLNTSTTRLRLGASLAATPNAYANIIVSDVFVTLNLSESNRQKLEGWIAHNRGLTGLLDAGHPYKSSPP